MQAKEVARPWTIRWLAFLVITLALFLGVGAFAATNPVADIACGGMEILSVLALIMLLISAFIWGVAAIISRFSN